MDGKSLRSDVWKIALKKSIDEAKFNLWLKRSRAPKGQRAVRVTTGRTGQNFILIMVVCNQRGSLKHDIFDHSVKLEIFNNFVTDLVMTQSQDAYIIFDNAPSHRSAHHLNLANGNLIKFVPPYSPFLNICENAFSV